MRAVTILMRATLLLMTAIAVTGSAVAQLDNRGGRSKEQLPSSVNLQDAKKLELRDSSGDVILSGKFEQKNASLTGSGSGRGSAMIEVQDSAQSLETSVEGLPGATMYKVVVDGKEIGTFSTDRTGKRTVRFSRS